MAPDNKGIKDQEGQVSIEVQKTIQPEILKAKRLKVEPYPLSIVTHPDINTDDKEQMHSRPYILFLPSQCLMYSAYLFIYMYSYPSINFKLQTAQHMQSTHYMS